MAWPKRDKPYLYYVSTKFAFSFQNKTLNSTIKVVHFINLPCFMISKLLWPTNLSLTIKTTRKRSVNRNFFAITWPTSVLDCLAELLLFLYSKRSVKWCSLRPLACSLLIIRASTWLVGGGGITTPKHRLYTNQVSQSLDIYSNFNTN